MGALSIRTSAEFNASAERVWEIVANGFIDISDWARTVNTSRVNPAATKVLEGAPVGGRICEIDGLGEVTESIIHFDGAKREITYAASSDKFPAFISGMQNAWTIEEIGVDSARVTSTISVTLTGLMGRIVAPMMKRNFAKSMNLVLEDLGAYAETGEVSRAKQERTEQVA